MNYFKRFLAINSVLKSRYSSILLLYIPTFLITDESDEGDDLENFEPSGPIDFTSIKGLSVKITDDGRAVSNDKKENEQARIDIFLFFQYS